ncbi:hypothetical protein BDF21DRAFT_457861 [Thamnidium elegans]|uniref:Uncharacterized protein n=1 Tax=Thamnidium elegans TaxID=101142 RepID=A0A8H7SSG6_9FUNG|nr:hypothetical protein INT48_009429 [Thamnidium elegans]KAI8095572.1 hypothetical protein BDF21DRAFT_457861 [Thamnidium elegans]
MNPTNNNQTFETIMFDPKAKKADGRKRQVTDEPEGNTQPSTKKKSRGPKDEWTPARRLAVLKLKTYRLFIYNRKRRLELTKRRYCDKTTAIEGKFSGTKKPIMFIGGRGRGIRSSIKGHQRFGEFKKQNKHGQNTPTLITNEYNGSQTCLFCFNKLSHPVSAAADKISISKGTFICLNSNCPKAFKPMCRDKVSALISLIYPLV